MYLFCVSINNQLNSSKGILLSKHQDNGHVVSYCCTYTCFLVVPNCYFISFFVVWKLLLFLYCFCICIFVLCTLLLYVHSFCISTFGICATLVYVQLCCMWAFVVRAPLLCAPLLCAPLLCAPLLCELQLYVHIYSM